MEYPPQGSARWLLTEERTAFYDSLAPEAKTRFLEALEAAAASGLDEQKAWEEAVIAAETTYSGPKGEGRARAMREPGEGDD